MFTYGMARLTATFACPKCKAVYQCEYLDFWTEGRREFQCENCKTVVHSWRGSGDYIGFAMIKGPDPDSKT